MRYLAWLVKIALFLLLFVFTLKNGNHVTVHGLLDASWDAPLIVFLLIFFVAGATGGLLAMLPPYFRVRRELAEAKKQLKAKASPSTPISPDQIEPAVPLDAVI